MTEYTSRTPAREPKKPEASKSMNALLTSLTEIDLFIDTTFYFLMTHDIKL